jgi:A nuclease of the HNH/ENDO VII superfamily with conserved WHH
MNKINKFIITVLVFVFSTLVCYAQNTDCPVFLLANDLSSSSAEFKAIVKETNGFESWQLLNKEATALRTDITELTLVSKNLDAIKNAGYMKWKAVNGAGNLVPSSLITKLTQQGATKLKAWTSGKNLNYKSLLGTNHTGVTAEAKIFEDLESAIGNKNVLATIEDGQGRLSVVLERPGQTHQVVSVHTTSTGELKMTTFEPAYNPNLNTNIPVPASANKLVPDYATTQYLHSLNQGKVIRIEMSGTRATDFTRANAELGVASKPTNYTWHHLDDFEVVNGKVYCTMQLVQSSAHGGSGISGMAHTGSVAQWKAYFGTTVYP